MVRTQVAELRSDTTRYARIAMRSIRALGLGFSGNTAAAGESLLVLERMHGDSTGKVWGAFAADRLLGAQWLTEHGKPAAADSLLRFTQGWAIAGMAGAAYPIAGAAHLQRSRIAESMGNRDKAVEYSRIFLAAYDLPSPRAKAWVDEAKARIKRLGGTVDNVPATTVPLRRKPE